MLHAYCFRQSELVSFLVQTPRSVAKSLCRGAHSCKAWRSVCSASCQRTTVQSRSRTMTCGSTLAARWSCWMGRSVVVDVTIATPVLHACDNRVLIYRRDERPISLETAVPWLKLPLSLHLPAACTRQPRRRRARTKLKLKSWAALHLRRRPRAH